MKSKKFTAMQVAPSALVSASYLHAGIASVLILLERDIIPSC